MPTWAIISLACLGGFVLGWMAGYQIGLWRGQLAGVRRLVAEADRMLETYKKSIETLGGR
jgi:hypothetical protein